MKCCGYTTKGERCSKPANNGFFCHHHHASDQKSFENALERFIQNCGGEDKFAIYLGEMKINNKLFNVFNHPSLK